MRLIYVNMLYRVNIEDIYVNKRANYVIMQEMYVNMRDDYVDIKLI